MKRITTFIFLIGLVFTSSISFAGDRAQLVQSRIHSSLSAILPKTDFLVIVNRLDAIEESGGNAVYDGNLKILPGINLGVNASGNLVRQDQAAGSYSGPVSINVMIEDKVRAETFKTIEKVLPDIIGGIRDTDEVRIAKAALRQPPIVIPGSNQPNISINNGGNSKDQTQENIKFLSLLLLTGGLFFWFLSRFTPQSQGSNANSSPNVSAPPQPALAEDAKDSQEVKRSDFAVLEAEAVALFLLKEINDENAAIVAKWVKFAPSTHQREVFRHLPSWVLTYIKEMDTKTEDEQPNEKELSMHDLFNEMALIEQTFKSDDQKKKAFLQWFPAEALRKIPKKHQNEFTVKSRKTLWSLRPDLGNFVRVDAIHVDQMMEEPSSEDIRSCVEELYSLPSVAFESDSLKSNDLPTRWSVLINQLDEFSPIQSQLDQAKINLSQEDYEKLCNMVAHLHSPLSFNPNSLKSWLREVDPADYAWWLELLGNDPGWSLENELRPMRFTMFQDALMNPGYDHWDEQERKDSSERLLDGFKEILKVTKTSSMREAA